jgi:hypothetical protein
MDAELALLRELEQLRRERRNWRGCAQQWPLTERRREDVIFEELDGLREREGK